jgi:hypothetical protein
MAKVIKRIEYSSRSITFHGTVVFVSMGKYVTDFMRMFKLPGFTVTAMTEAEYVPCDCNAMKPGEKYEPLLPPVPVHPEKDSK